MKRKHFSSAVSRLVDVLKATGNQHKLIRRLAAEAVAGLVDTPEGKSEVCVYCASWQLRTVFLGTSRVGALVKYLQSRAGNWELWFHASELG